MENQIGGTVSTTRESAEERFRLPGSSYVELAKIIRAYGSLDKEAVPADVGTRAVVHPTIVSHNNAFLVAIDVIKGGKKKIMTEKGRALARALDHDMPEVIRENWRAIIQTNEFLQKVVTAVRIRKGMEPSTLQAHIAYSAGVSKKPAVMTGAATVIDILKVAGLIKEEEGKLVAVTEEALTERVEPAPTSIFEKVLGKTAPIVTFQPGKGKLDSGFAVTIQIQVQCTASEIGDLGPRLRSLLKEIARADVSQEPEGND